MNSPQLLSASERCQRLGYWSLDWQRHKLDGNEMLRRGIYAGLVTGRKDYGQCAGEELYALGVNPGIESAQYDIHSEVVHLACLSDIIVTVTRKDAAWKPSEATELPGGAPWRSDVLLDPSGTHLRSIHCVSSWSPDRHYATCRAWESLANVCIYEMPLQIGVCIIGSNKNGKRHSFWTHGLRHPVSKQLRFRKKTDKSNPFKSTWLEVWREDYDEISTSQWIEGMLSDGVLPDICFSVEVPIPEKSARQKIIDLAARKLDLLYSLKELPMQNLSTCDWPSKCDFRSPCHSGAEPSGRFGFVRVDQINPRL
jgi:hypothetical protein